jgi:hypothetical protein
MKRLLSLMATCFFAAAIPAAAEEISLLPPSAYDRSAIYIDLALFWVATIVLIVLIRLKLREIERVQAMEAKANGEATPLLD